MKWTRGHQSANVEDRRARGGGMQLSGVGILGPLFARFGVPGLVVGVALLYFANRGLDGGAPAASAPDEQAMLEFVSFVFDDAQQTWQGQAPALGAKFQPARMVVFRGRTSTGCGMGSAAVGPFYCPLDQQVYIDLSFYAELRERFGAPGDFAQAYVIAHELGHHVQHLLGLDEKVQRAGARATGADAASVRLELQADCFAGVWARSAQARGLLEAGDWDEALRAAAAIGDDRLQKQTNGTVQPESWTHGSSEQRARWLKRGFDQGKPSACDTFAAASL